MDGSGLLTLAAGWLTALSGPLCHPIVLLLQLQGCVILLGLAGGWYYAMLTRLKELRRILHAEADNPFAFLISRPEELLHSSQLRLPKVTIIMPVKGVNEHSVDNWRSQIASVYGGELQFLFVVESEDDVAHGAVLQLMSAAKGDIQFELIVAGHAVKSSQKIHNQLAGVSAMSASSKYVLFLDDDIRLHPGTICQLVDTMEADQKAFLLTGYPFDLPAPTLVSYCTLEYHLPLFIGFSTGGRTTFVWGGCMMMLADDWRTDRYGICGALKDGGYSDDMILASVAAANGRSIHVPSFAVFFHPLPADLTWERYWNYLRRQIFVLETYSSLYNRVLNRLLFLVHCYLSWGLVIPFLVAELHLLRVGALYWSINSGAYNQLPQALVCTQGLRLSQALVLCLALAFVSLYRMTVVVIKLCNKLSPERPHIPVRIFKWHLMLAGFLIGNTLYPVCALYTFIKPSVEWSGILYTRYAGRIYKVQRQVTVMQQNRTAAEQSTNSGLLSEAQAFVNQAVLLFAKVSPRFSKELKKSENP
eukprot:SM000177S03179  [mRNA]  locus=s177:35680:39904:- [translate_table: standard]